MRTIISAAALVLLSVSAHATNPPPKDPSVESNASSQAVGVGVGIGVGIAGGGDAHSSSSSNAASVALGGRGGEASAVAVGGEGGASDATAAASVGDVTANGGESYSEGSRASSDNAVNITSNYKGVRNAPSIALGSIFPTANCQAGVGVGGSGVNGSGLLNFSFTKKECEAFLLAQHFVSIGMPDISCEVLKTTKAFKRAEKQYPELRMLTDCTPAPKVSAVPVPPQPVDLSRYATKEEVDRAFRKALAK